MGQQQLEQPVQVQQEVKIKRRRPHKIFGEYIKVKVYHKRNHNKDTRIFVSINNYTIEFPPEMEQWIPVKIAEFLKKAASPVHYYDPEQISENGNKGRHMTRFDPDYIVEYL